MPNVIKWFFLVFIALVFVAVNAVAFDSRLGIASTISIAVAANLFALSLVVIWLGSYYQGLKDAGFLVFGHATLMLSAGLGIVALGIHGLLVGGCGFLISDRAIPGTISKVAAWATEHGVCPWLSMLFVLFGLFMLWPSLKLFYGITLRSRRTR
jgi:hypothetical protein